MTHLTRRNLLRLFGVAGVGMVAQACSADNSTIQVPDPTVGPATSTPPPSAPSTSAPSSSGTPVITATPGANTPLTAADFDGLGTCQLLRSSTAGPFPTLEQLDRRDITEGYPGHPVRLGFRVVDADCNPVPGGQVEVWHTDASGDYSSYDDGGSGKDEGAGTTFCRGVQTCDEDGITEFTTIHPGWYPGRAVHIHLRARVKGSEVITGQIYFPDDHTAEVLASGEYAQYGQPQTLVSQDRIAGDPATEGALLAVSPAETALGLGTLALLNLGVSV